MNEFSSAETAEPKRRTSQYLVGCAMGVVAVFLSQASLACRCAELTLAEYFDNASEVFAATLLETIDDSSGQREFLFRKHGEPFKSAPGESSVRYVSHTSSAACAVTPEAGADYVVFAELDESSGVGWITSCNGTRRLRSKDGATSEFTDVPHRFVVSQLTALSGLNALAEVSRVEGSAQDLNNTTIVGLLDVAGLTHTEDMPLFSKPSLDACVRARIQTYDQLKHRESGYEVDAALVYAISGAGLERWYKVKLADGSFAWVAPDAAGTYAPLDEVLPNRLNYLTAQWNRLVWPMPGAGLPIRVGYSGDSRPREQAANVLSAQRIGDSLWLEIGILKSSPCERDDPRTLARGWIPAYSMTGEPVAWFYSRGC